MLILSIVFLNQISPGLISITKLNSALTMQPTNSMYAIKCKSFLQVFRVNFKNAYLGKLIKNEISQCKFLVLMQ